MLETHIKLCVTEPDFPEKISFSPKIGKMGQNQGFLYLLKNLVINFYCICSIKIYIICCVLAQIPYFGKCLFLTYGQKCYQPDGNIISPSVWWTARFLINQISRTNQWNNLIFSMLIQIYINLKVIKVFLGGHCQK